MVEPYISIATYDLCNIGRYLRIYARKEKQGHKQTEGTRPRHPCCFVAAAPLLIRTKATAWEKASEYTSHLRHQHIRREVSSNGVEDIIVIFLSI